MRSLLLFSLLLAYPVLGLATPATLFSFEGWIGEGRPAFRAEQAFQQKLHQTRSTGSEEVGLCSLAPGEELPFLSSFVVTKRSQVVRLAQDLDLQVTWWGKLSVLSKTAYYDAGQQRALRLPAGASVERLMPRAEGSCLFRAREEVFQTACAAVPGFPATDSAVHEWWLEVQCGKASGWMLIDERIQKTLRQKRRF